MRRPAVKRLHAGCFVAVNSIHSLRNRASVDAKKRTRETIPAPGSMSPDTIYDYIIVGAGSAGCVLANRLTASGRHRGLLLEAGEDDRWMWIKIPAGIAHILP